MQKNRTLKDWIIATRPWSFPASVMPILIMWGYLFFIGHNGIDVDWLNAILCMPLLVIAHAGGNMVSDYYDYTRRVDLEDCPNGVTWIYDGTFSARTILRFGLVLLAVALPIGLFLLVNSDISAIWIGIVGMLLPLLYPWMKAHALGDVNILVSFALLPALGTAFVSTGIYMPETLLYILPLGLLTVSILHANNTRDMANDSRAGLSTLSAMLGLGGSKTVYLIEVFSPYVLAVVFVVFCHQPATLLATLLTVPLAVRNVRMMMAAVEKKQFLGIATLDKSSAQLQTLFGLLYAAGYFMSVLC